ncbi:hypothetical protein N7471_009796 [Penicillium samsonianum]|uniref:uncharacterized protein n=1 Tax=Penicillium samsonianum TaxID=1882272 RepID=UPI0025481D17|nr:uncharacterized protein N7471_009796 [Penicillium samsonianum]KAJ6128579.1 hypothetical protein N7471_009796 [Penicillium samsonianum]
MTTACNVGYTGHTSHAILIAVIIKVNVNFVETKGQSFHPHTAHSELLGPSGRLDFNSRPATSAGATPSEFPAQGILAIYALATRTLQLQVRFLSEHHM